MRSYERNNAIGPCIALLTYRNLFIKLMVVGFWTTLEAHEHENFTGAN